MNPFDYFLFDLIIFDSIRLFSIQFNSIVFDSIRCKSIIFNSIRFISILLLTIDSVSFNSIQLYSMRVDSIRFFSIRIESFRFDSILFDSNRFFSFRIYSAIYLFVVSPKPDNSFQDVSYLSVHASVCNLDLSLSWTPDLPFIWNEKTGGSITAQQIK